MASKMVLFILMALGPTLLAAMEGETINEQLRRAVSQVVPTSRVLHGFEIQFVVPPKDLDDIEKLLLLGGDPNFRPHESDRPLLEIALEKGRTDLATMLLERGASFNHVNLWT
jgi:ankyrin repeat protein